MPDINDKFVVHYAVRGYRTGQTPTISIYDTAGTAEIDAQTMTELGTSGIYYFNWFPKKRTTYLAVMDCTAYPLKSHQVIRIEKTKVSGAVTIPKVKIPPSIWKADDKDRLFKKLSELSLDRTDDIIDSINDVKSTQKSSSSSITKEIAELRVDRSSLLKQLESISKERATLADEAGKTRNELTKQASTFYDHIQTEFAKISQSSILEKLDSLAKACAELAQVSDESIANVKLSNEVFNKDFREKIEHFSSLADELILLMKNARSTESSDGPS